MKNGDYETHTDSDAAALITPLRASPQRWFSFKKDADFHMLVKLLAVTRGISMTELFELAISAWVLTFGTEDERMLVQKRVHAFPIPEVGLPCPCCGHLKT